LSRKIALSAKDGQKGRLRLFLKAVLFPLILPVDYTSPAACDLLLRVWFLAVAQSRITG
jgi:hypothetical protein